MDKLLCSAQEISTTVVGHTHRYAHIIVPLSDPMYLRYQTHELLLTSSQIAFVPPECYHEYCCSARVLVFNIPAPMIKKSDLIALNERAVVPIDEKLALLVGLIRREAEDKPNCDSIRYLFYYLYDKLVQTGEIKSLQYINEHFSEDISVSELAAIENYTPAYYSDWFRRKTGHLPSLYLQRVRIDKAKELLAHTHYPILDIAFQTGYTTNSTFTRAFKELEGISPRRYREQYWSEAEKHGLSESLFEANPCMHAEINNA